MRQRIYDESTGEVIRDEEFKVTKKFKQSHYYLTFYTALSKSDINLTGTMQAILGQMDSKNRISLDKSRLHTLQSVYKKSPNAIRVACCRMCKAGLLQQTDVAFYFANPYYFSKSNINQLRNIRFEYLEYLYTRKKEMPDQEVKRIAQLEKQIKDVLSE